jgi:PAS domain S-box-containing protein
MFTNSGTQEIAVEAMKAGLDDYVIKSPKHYIRLATAVRRAWERFETKRQSANLENRFQTLLNQLDVGVFRMTSDGTLLEGNAAFWRLLGLSTLPEEQVGRSLEPYFQPGDYAQLLNQLKPNGQIRNREVQLRRADGSTIWIRLSKTFNTTDDTAIVDGLIEDITERKQAEVALLKAKQMAEAANRIKDEFLAVLSHELRSPLNPILGWIKIIRGRKCDEATVTRALEVIERNAQLQTQLIEDLLDVSSILRGKLSLKIDRINLQTTIEAALETVHLAAQAKSIQIDTVFEPNIGQVSGDPNRLQQVIWNLLSNAVKFTPSGGRVEVRLESNNRHAAIRVSDTGKGINPDFLPHVFDYFRQESSTTTRAFGGLGLGLAIVRYLTELHGGTVCAESAGAGRGATFTVMLPLLEREQLTVEREQPDSLDSALFAPQFPLAGVRVLLVDDEEDARELFVFMLEQYGARVRAVSSALEALGAIAQWQPDILLSDIGMPEVDGYMLIQQIRAMPKEQGTEIKAIALTAYAGETDHQKILQAGFQRHITKPVEPAELAAAIATLVGRTASETLAHPRSY